MALSAFGRMIARWRWVSAGEQLSGPTAPPPPPRTSIRFFLFSRDDLGTAARKAPTPATAASQVPLHRYVATPESLPPAETAPPSRSLARADRSNFWRWLFTPETLPRTDAGPAGGARSHPTEP